MNAHDRRKASRSRHMALPLGKEVCVGPLLGRCVYAYGPLGCNVTIDAETLAKFAAAKVSRHVRPKTGGLVDLVLTSKHGDEQCISTSMRGIRLKNPADRAMRPWWSAQLRRSRA